MNYSANPKQWVRWCLDKLASSLSSRMLPGILEAGHAGAAAVVNSGALEEIIDAKFAAFWLKFPSR